MAHLLTLEREDVDNLLACLDGILRSDPSDFVKIGLVPLIGKIEAQTGVKLEEHAPRAVPREVIEKYRRKAAVLDEEEARRTGTAPPLMISAATMSPCASHPLDLYGETCPRCGIVV